MAKYLFTSESVTEGHPDKICDQISDAVLDAIIAKDPQARVACETAVTTGMVLIMGEISTNCYVDIPAVARDVIRGIGYDRAKFGFDYATCAVLTSIDMQSPDIAMGVNESLETARPRAIGRTGGPHPFAGGIDVLRQGLCRRHGSVHAQTRSRRGDCRAG